MEAFHFVKSFEKRNGCLSHMQRRKFAAIAAYCASKETHVLRFLDKAAVAGRIVCESYRPYCLPEALQCCYDGRPSASALLHASHAASVNVPAERVSATHVPLCGNTHPLIFVEDLLHFRPGTCALRLRWESHFNHILSLLSFRARPPEARWRSSATKARESRYVLFQCHTP